MTIQDSDQVIAALKVAMSVTRGQLRVGQLIINCLPPDCKQDPYYVTNKELARFLYEYARKHGEEKK